VLSAAASELPEDAAEESTEAAVRRAGGLWLVDGRMDIHRAERLLGAKA
jgi:CBS domain containing-hemolysin-like protein